MPRRKAPILNDPEMDDIPGYQKAKLPGPDEPTPFTPPAEDGFVVDEPPVATGADGNQSASLFSKDRTFNAQQHDWVQHGRQLSCSTCPENHRHGTIIAAGLMLVGERGKWKLVPEGGMLREDLHAKP